MFGFCEAVELNPKLIFKYDAGLQERFNNVQEHQSNCQLSSTLQHDIKNEQLRNYRVIGWVLQLMKNITN